MIGSRDTITEKPSGSPAIPIQYRIDQAFATAQPRPGPVALAPVAAATIDPTATEPGGVLSNGAETVPSAAARRARLRYIPLQAVAVVREDVRRAPIEGEIEVLALSLREKGMAQPIVVRPRADAFNQFELVAGHRRLRAARKAGLEEVPAVILDRLGEEEVIELSIVENLQRRNLTPIEEARAYELLTSRGRTHQQIAGLVGRSRSHVSNVLRLLSLPADVQDMLHLGKISYGHARALLAAEHPGDVAGRIVAEQLTVRAAERLAGGRPPAAAAARADTVTPLPTAPRPLPAEPALGQAEPEIGSSTRPEPTPLPTPMPAAVVARPASPRPAAVPPGDAETLAADIARHLGVATTVSLAGPEAVLRLAARTPQEVVQALVSIRDALQLLRMNSLLDYGGDTTLADRRLDRLASSAGAGARPPVVRSEGTPAPVSPLVLDMEAPADPADGVRSVAATFAPRSQDPSSSSDSGGRAPIDIKRVRNIFRRRPL
jgi:ParB family chromosome partitioning protein